MNPARPTRQGVVAAISGFTPMRTGLLCDLCNAAFSEGDEVLVTLDHTEGRFEREWHARSTYCADHDIGPSEFGTNAVVRCEIGMVQGESAPLYNPEVVAFHEGGDN